MAKNIQKPELTKRDLLLAFMFVVIVATNVLWYLHVRALQLTDKNDATSWLHQQAQINKLKACIDEGTKPCDITPFINNE